MTATNDPDRPGPANSRPDVAGAVDLLQENLRLLTGHPPVRQRLVAGRAQVHRVALVWLGQGGDPQVCVQVIAGGELDTTRPGWLPSEAHALAEALDLKAHGEQRSDDTATCRQWRRHHAPAYYLVLVDSMSWHRLDHELTRRCAALEAGYLEGAGWLRFYTDSQFAEGSFPRLMERTASDVRRRLGTSSETRERPRGYGGLC